MKSRILVVAHEPEVRATLARWLMAAGHAVELAEGPKRAREVAGAQPLSLAIVAVDDVGGAGVDALELGNLAGALITIRDRNDAPSTSAPPANGLILKPLEHDEVLRAVDAVLRPPAGPSPPDEPEWLRFEGYTLAVAGRTCVDAKGTAVPLTRTEFSVLLMLARQAGRVLSRDRLRQEIAGREAGPDDRSVDMLISRLRRKIESDPKEPRIIVTMAGEGYKFMPRTEAVAVAPEPATAPTADAGTVAPPSTARAPSGRRAWFAPVIGSIGAALAVVLALMVWYLGHATRSPPQTREQTVDARSSWQALMNVEGPGTIEFRVTGKWTFNPDQPAVDANGDCRFSTRGRRTYPFGESNGCEGQLIGRIGNGKSFIVGTQSSHIIEPDEKGPLYLVINDDLADRAGAGLNDNSGRLTATVTVQAR